MSDLQQHRIVTMKEAVVWCRENGIAVSEWHLRELVKSGAIPCRQTRAKGKYFISTQNIWRYFNCVDSQDNPPLDPVGGIRRQS